MLKYATLFDIFLIMVGILSSLANGSAMPLLFYFFGNIVDEYSKYTSTCLNSSTLFNKTASLSSSNSKEFMNEINKLSFLLAMVAIGTMICSFIEIACWLVSSERQMNKLRKELFKAIFRQEIEWFDTNKCGELVNNLTNEINIIKQGIGDKFGNALEYASIFVTGLIITMMQEWKLALVILSISPLILISSIIYAHVVHYYIAKELNAYGKAGAIAEEVFTAIRTVFTFNGVRKEHERYTAQLNDAKKCGIKKGFITGLTYGFTRLCINSCYALGFWYGWKLIQKANLNNDVHKLSSGTIVTALFTVLYGVSSLGYAIPFIAVLSEAKSTAYKLYEIIERKNKIDINNENGEKPNDLVGDIEFKDVDFNYPSRTDVTVLNKLNMQIKAGSVIAIVGKSGSGKSTCINLLQRFYDPLNGSIHINGKNIKDYNLAWLRKHIGVVCQEPVLFDATISENIRMGKEDATQEEIENIAKNINIHDFIMSLPNKYDTRVGHMGSHISGGQKQRIALARALIRNPNVLLLDEATSALDRHSESIVKASLEKAKIGRTMIIVAHRLSTVKTADLIYVMDKGKIIEYGNHEYLLEQKGLYYDLVKTQEELETEENDDENLEDKITIASEDTCIDEVNEQNDKADEDERRVKGNSFFELIALNKSNVQFVLLGCLGSAMVGGVEPCFAIIYSNIIVTLNNCNEEKQKQDITFYSIMFVVIGIGTLIGHILQSGMFSISGERITKSLRSKMFQKMLSQELAWFEKPENCVGKLCVRLHTEIATVQAACGRKYGYIVLCFSNLGVGIIISFIQSWPVTLLILGFMPFIVISGIIQAKMITGLSIKSKKIYEEAGRIVTEALGNIRTVVTLSKENYFYNLYASQIESTYKSVAKSAFITGIGYGITNSVLYFAFAALFAVGAYLIENHLFEADFRKILIVFGCLIYGSNSIAPASAVIIDISKGNEAASKLFEFFKRKPKIDNWNPQSNSQVNDKSFQAKIEFDSVKFQYPNKIKRNVLDNFSITINQGENVAIVGKSGCGKSTFIQLLERFYDPETGNIKISGKDIKELDLHWVRSQIGLVSQEPILFDTSITENIAYGDNSRKVSKEEIIEAAKQANIHDFIMKLPNAYDTNVGARGVQLSGGQKQRIAIARALIRNPKIILLDEATSALDIESEMIIDETLKRVVVGRTCIRVAHRLSTIKNADVIYFLHEGKIAAYGTHEQLMTCNRLYRKLQQTYSGN